MTDPFSKYSDEQPYIPDTGMLGSCISTSVAMQFASWLGGDPNGNGIKHWKMGCVKDGYQRYLLYLLEKKNE